MYKRQVDGLFYGGGFEQLKIQAIGAFAVLAFSFLATLVIGKLLDLLMGFRIDSDAEVSGVDLAEHAETGYDLSAAPTGRGTGSAFAGAGIGSVASGGGDHRPGSEVRRDVEASVTEGAQA